MRVVIHATAAAAGLAAADLIARKIQHRPRAVLCLATVSTTLDV
ncbi:MAG: hypothetical protein ACK55S_15300 [Planctomycetota bacterium]